MMGKSLLALSILLLVGPMTPAVAQSSPAQAECLGLEATILGTDGDDVIDGTAGNDVIVGFDGDDVINGLEGDDTICG
jgi:Ca2+-binding RTX toxin-like protein